MALDQFQAARVLTRLSDRLRKRRPVIDQQVNYLRGKSGRLRFASDEFADYFTERFDGFSDNWVAPVAQAPAERMTHLGVRLPGQTRPDRELHRAFVENECDRGLSEAILMMITTGWSYALVSPEDGQTPRITFEHPAQAIVENNAFTGDPQYGLILWTDDEDGFDYAQLLTDDGEVWRLRRPTTKPGDEEWRETDLFGWRERPDTEAFTRHNLPGLPLIEFRNQSLLDDLPISDIAGVMSMQDSINLTWAYLLNALDYASLKQRVVLNSGPPMRPILNENGDVVGKKPVELQELTQDRVVFLDGENVSIGEWSTSNLDAFSKVIEHAVEHIAAQTRTPPHYLVARMVNTSAESLTIAEAGLVSKTQERITYVNPSLRRLYWLVAAAMGDDQKAAAVRSAKLLWKDVQYRSEAQRSDALQKKRAMGYPLEYILELDGTDPDEIPRILELREKEVQMDPIADIARQMSVTGAVPDGDSD